MRHRLRAIPLLVLLLAGCDASNVPSDLALPTDSSALSDVRTSDDLPAPDDLAAIIDQTASDLAQHGPLVDLGLDDFASADLATSDLSLPDLANPDLSLPDLATPDLSTPDLVLPLDLLAVDLVALPTCNDNLKNGNETDVDCGGKCPGCQPGRACLGNADCISHLCAKNVCQMPPASCFDGLLDGDESDVDCGGSCDATCMAGLACRRDADCSTGTCTAGRCRFTAAAVSFAPAGSYPIPDYVSTLCAGDLDADGATDLVLPTTQLLTVFRGNGDGTLAAAATFKSPVFSPSGCALADFDQDRALDLYVAGEPVVIAWGDGKGGFLGTPMLQMASEWSTAVADLNADGLPDVVAAQGDEFLDVRLGVPGFLGPVTQIPVFPATGGSGFVMLGDLDGDGKLDLADIITSGALMLYQNVVSLPGNGDGSFGASHLLGTKHIWFSGSGGTQGALADADGDGRLDLIADTGDGLAMYHGKGDGTFKAPNLPQTGNYAPNLGLSVTDFDGDGRVDLFVWSGSYALSTLYLGNGDGTFHPALTFNLPLVQFGLAADLNGDGKPDLAMAQAVNNGAGQMLIYLNTSK